MSRLNSFLFASFGLCVLFFVSCLFWTPFGHEITDWNVNWCVTEVNKMTFFLGVQIVTKNCAMLNWNWHREASLSRARAQEVIFSWVSYKVLAFTSIVHRSTATKTVERPWEVSHLLASSPRVFFHFYSASNRHKSYVIHENRFKSFQNMIGHQALPNLSCT